MTTYQIISITIAILALIQPWGIAIYKKYFKKAKVSFIPSAKIKLYYNRSGAYIYLGGVISSKSQGALIKDIYVKVIRQNDKAELEMTWSSFIAPVFQSIGGNPVTTSEIARPFMVDHNGLVPIFVEFVNVDVEANDHLFQVYETLQNEAKRVANSSISFEQAKIELQSSQIYKNIHEELIENFYWKATGYHIEMAIQYNNEKIIRNRYRFSLNQEEAAQLKGNIDKAMLYDIYHFYGQPNNFSCAQKDFIILEG